MTEQEKQILEQMRAESYALLNDISKDFTDDRALSDSDYISDSFTEYADSAISIYYKDQYNYYVDHSEECENALLELYDKDSLADIIKKEGLYNLCCKAGACGAFMENERQLYDDLANIKVCLIIDFLLNINEYLKPSDIEEIADLDLDRWDDYADQVNEKLKEEK